MRTVLFGTIALICLSTSYSASTYKKELPRVLDPRLEVKLIADDPAIVHPVAITFDKKGRLLVVESHSHFRPAGYQGPPHDRIRLLEEPATESKPARFSTFFEGTKSTMDIATHPDGSIYVATRNEILRLRDTKGTGTADEKTRLIHLETKGDYPHNGLSGLAFDKEGNLIFGLGENLGASYKIIGSDGITLSGGGEGGNIYRCNADGSKLRLYATGFWNPFGIHMDQLGRIIAVDNDPDASPPCRMLHVVEGGDYGYQFRYGRSGRHPFQSWDGQLPGTLPMICGVGEAPCEVLRYESHGLSSKYFGKHFVTSWADHRLEMYRLEPRGISYKAKQQVLVQGGKDFRPCGMAIAPDGSIYLSDWVLPDYNLHGKGAIWQVRAKMTVNTTIEEGTRGSFKFELPDTRPMLKPQLASEDPFEQLIARQMLAKDAKALSADPFASYRPSRVLCQVLLSQRETGDVKFQKRIPEYLRSTHEDLQFLAAKWVSDLALKEYRSDIETALQNTKLTPRMTLAFATALARIDGQEVSETRIADRFVERLNDPKLTPEQRQQFLKLIPVTHPKLTVKLLQQMLSTENQSLQQDVALSLTLHPKPERLLAMKTAIEQGKLSRDATAIMEQSLQPSTTAKSDYSKGRPPVENTDAWLQAFGKNGNASAGRRVFFSQNGPGCYRCHTLDGRGNDVGPDLTTIGRMEPRRIMESLLQPSATVAPQHQAYTLVMKDGRTLTGTLVRTYLDTYTYLSPEGKQFEVKTYDVEETAPAKKSLMPEGLLNQLSDQEVRDLVAFLLGSK
jgi:putative membrane-bound dehydrogenase-like protein